MPIESRYLRSAAELMAREAISRPGSPSSYEDLNRRFLEIADAYIRNYDRPSPPTPTMASSPSLTGRTGTPSLEVHRHSDGTEYKASKPVLIRVRVTSFATTFHTAQCVEKGGTGHPSGSRPLHWRTCPAVGKNPEFFELDKVVAWLAIPSFNAPAQVDTNPSNVWADMNAFFRNSYQRATPTPEPGWSVADPAGVCEPEESRPSAAVEAAPWTVTSTADCDPTPEPRSRYEQYFTYDLETVERSVMAAAQATNSSVPRTATGAGLSASMIREGATQLNRLTDVFVADSVLTL